MIDEYEEAEVETHAEWALRIKRERMACNRAQAIIAMRGAGVLPAVEAFMAAPETPDNVKDAWGNSPRFTRLAPLVTGMGAALGLTEDQLDGLFEAAMAVDA